MGCHILANKHVLALQTSVTVVMLLVFSAIIYGCILHVVADIIPKKIKYSDYLELVKKGQHAKSTD